MIPYDKYNVNEFKLEEEVFMDIADNRLKTWLHDFYDQERGRNEKIL